MVHENNDTDTQNDETIVTYDNTDTDTMTDTELGDDEKTAEQKLKALRTKLQTATDEVREVREELQRTKADFLNARRRLDEEVIRTRERDTIKHIEKLLPLADSFYLATLDKDAWEKGDEKWRKGIEGIYQQLLGTLRGYGVESFNPTNELFDPQKHEALSTITVADATQHDHVLTVMQLGYTVTTNGTTTVIRPARVTVAEYKQPN